MQLGFMSYIIADPALIVYLREKGIPCEIHMSGEMGEINRRTVEVFQRLDLKRGDFSQEKQLRGYAVCDLLGKKCRWETGGDRV